MKKNKVILTGIFLFSLAKPLTVMAGTIADESPTFLLIAVLLTLVVVISLILDEIGSTFRDIMDTDGILNKLKFFFLAIGKIFLWLIGSAVVLLILLIGDAEVIAKILAGIHVWAFGGYVLFIIVFGLLAIIFVSIFELAGFLKEKTIEFLKKIFHKVKNKPV